MYNKNEFIPEKIIDYTKKVQVLSEKKAIRDISIWLDNYDDIFSDFDPRPFSERNVSDDFLYELKKVCRERKSSINVLQLLVPEKSRNLENEMLIVKRLHSHLKQNFHVYKQLVKIQKRNGFIFVSSGMLIMILASYISLLKSGNFIMHTLLVMLEPAGWFILWTGLDDLMKIKHIQKAELDLFLKMEKSKIVFSNI
jgi:hypothetical protein